VVDCDDFVNIASPWSVLESSVMSAFRRRGCARCTSPGGRPPLVSASRINSGSPYAVPSRSTPFAVPLWAVWLSV